MHDIMYSLVCSPFNKQDPGMIFDWLQKKKKKRRKYVVFFALVYLAIMID